MFNVKGWFHARRDGEENWGQANFERMLRVQITRILNGESSIYASDPEKISEHYNHQKPLWFLRSSND